MKNTNKKKLKVKDLVRFDSFRCAECGAQVELLSGNNRHYYYR